MLETVNGESELESVAQTIAQLSSNGTSGGIDGMTALSGRVVNVYDRDTVTLLDDDNRQHRIRIAGINAPEKAQPFGNRSRQNLASMAHDQETITDCPKKDRYGRRVCKVWVQPSGCPACEKTLDVGYAQISAGLGWWYRAYAKEQTAEDRERYESEETDSHLRKRGLWTDKDPVAPWKGRKIKRND